MDLPGWDRETSPFHAGELELQTRLGRKERLDPIARKIFRPFMPEQHRTFFSELPFIVAGSVDQQGRPWASILFGEPGFVSSPDNKSLQIETTVLDVDPFFQNAANGAPIGFVGLELPTRRRNRVNGLSKGFDGKVLGIEVTQSFGNCPQYIHTRDLEFVRNPRDNTQIARETFTTFRASHIELISQADTFFVASYNPQDDARDTGGVDVNHRGGKPGFIRVDGNTLTIPDFIGNFIFNTFGNFLVNPKAGLLFIDFDTGDLMQLTGTVELNWDATEDIKAFKGAERSWTFTLDSGHVLKAASPLQFRDGEMSPSVSVTSDWAEAQTVRKVRAQQNIWRPFRVTRIEDESTTIRSFYLEPSDGLGRIDHRPGQYLPIRITPNDVDAPNVRTYTLSSAPDATNYRISVKRDGLVSQFLHDAVGVGDVIETQAPRGDFWMDIDELRPAVLIAGGVGITPMISMVTQAMLNRVSHRHLRQMTVFHSVQRLDQGAFRDSFSNFQEESDGKIRYVSIVSQEKVAIPGVHVGHLDAGLLQSYLPLDDYDFFLCGPPGFMQATYDMLISIGVSDGRIQAEAFGPAALNRHVATDAPEPFEPATESVVEFTASGVEQTWSEGDGTLLSFAENHGLAPNYGCRNGACGSCAVKLVSGKVGYVTKPTFDADDDEILLCCSVPAKSDEALKIEV